MDRFADPAGEQLDPLGLELPFSETPHHEQPVGLALELLHDTPFAGELEQDVPAFAGEDEHFENEAGIPHSFKGFTNSEKNELIDAAERARLAVQRAAAFVATARARPDRMSVATKTLLQTHFHTTKSDHLYTIFTRFGRIAKALKEGVKFEARRACKGRDQGYAHTTQWFGGRGRVIICYDTRPGHSNFTGPATDPDEQEAIVIHEVAHRYVGIEDKAYKGTAAYPKLSPSKAVDNADSYAYFAVEGKTALSEVYEGEDLDQFAAEDLDFFADEDLELYSADDLDTYHTTRRAPPPAPSSDLPATAGVLFPSGLTLSITTGATGEGEEHWDPHSTGLPLLATGSSVLARRLSDHFTVRELVTSGGLAAPVARISPDLVRALEHIRTCANRPVRITSGYRSWKRNNAVYAARGKRATLSRHCSGQAVDLKISGMTGMQMARLAIDAVGTEFGLGIGKDFIHVDVRPAWTLWNYIGGAAGRTAEGEIRQYRLAALKGGKKSPSPPPKPSPTPPPKPVPQSGNRIAVAKHPMLGGHRGAGSDLVLKWNAIPANGVIDVVVHFHGFGDPKMVVLKVKEPGSGLDFTDPQGSSGGRARPTLGIIPKGSYVGDQPGANPQKYAFPALMKPGALDAFIKDALQRVGAQVGAPLTQGRLILTGHSGGGAPVRSLLAHMDPNEVHIFDGMYEPGDSIAKWARKRIDRELANPTDLPPALRVQFIPGTQTEKHSVNLWALICPMLSPVAVARLRPYFRVEKTSVGHGSIPPRFGWRLLANAAADLPSATPLPCKSFASAGETEEQEWLVDPVSATEWLDAPLAEASGYVAHERFEPEVDDREDEEEYDSEQLAWLDVEASGPETALYAEEFEPELEGEEFDTEDEYFSHFQDEGPFEQAPLGYEGPYESEDEGDLELELFEDFAAAEHAAFALGPTLRRGSRGPAVTSLQESLVKLGAGIATDGQFGPATARAVQEFQSRSGLTPDGIVGPRTKAALLAALSGKVAPTPPAPVPPTGDLGATIARIAEQEYQRWHPPSGNLQETDNAAVPILQQYYREGLNRSVTATQLQDTAWQKQHPWSAVFVSWVMRTAGAGSRFAYSEGHVGYIRAARRNRLESNPTSPFWAYRATEVAPQVGDIICIARNNSGADYDNIAEPVHRDTHGDIVTEVRPGSLRVIGGNVRQNVDAKVVRTLPDGRLALDGKQALYFAVVRCRGAIGATPPGPVPIPPSPVPPSPPVGRKLTPREFVATYGPSARISQATYGVPPLVTLGQAAIESTWGEKAPRFNLFGIKAKATDPLESRQLLVTKEVCKDANQKFPEIISITPKGDGRYDYVVRDWFRAYPNAAAAFDAHGKLLRTAPRYAKAFNFPNDPYAFGAEIARAGYNTDRAHYERTLTQVMRMLEKASDGTLRETFEGIAWDSEDEGIYAGEETFAEEFFAEDEEELEDEFPDREWFDEAHREFGLEDRELDSDVLKIAERIMAREVPGFEAETPKKKTRCFSATDVARVKKAYEDNSAAADAGGSTARCSCIVMLNVALGELIKLPTKKSPARTGSSRTVDMAKLTTETIEKAMAQLQKAGFARVPTKLNFFNSRNGTAGTLAPVKLKSSLQKKVLSLAPTKGCWFAFGLSIMDGYHSVLLLVDRTGSFAKIFWLDQHSTGLDDDVTSSLDQKVTDKTVGWWKGVMEEKGKGYNTTIRLWPLLKQRK